MTSKIQRSRSAVAVRVLLLALLPASLVAEEDPGPEPLSTYAEALADAEVLRFGWGLGGFKGTLARLVIPGRGDAVMRTGRNADGHLVSELNISSPRSRHGDFQRYGAEMTDRSPARTRRAWTTQMFRGRVREREADLAGEEAVDIASSIWRLRHDPSFGVGRARLWSSGNYYPIEITDAGRGWGMLGERRVGTRTFLIEGLRLPDERFWKGRVELVLADDENATPLEIVLRQEGVKVRLVLLQG